MLEKNESWLVNYWFVVVVFDFRVWWWFKNIVEGFGTDELRENCFVFLSKSFTARKLEFDFVLKTTPTAILLKKITKNDSKSG